MIKSKDQLIYNLLSQGMISHQEVDLLTACVPRLFMLIGPLIRLLVLCIRYFMFFYDFLWYFNKLFSPINSCFVESDNGSLNEDRGGPIY